MHIIEQQALWLAMLEDRNQTTHRYDQEFVNRIANTIRTIYLPVFERLAKYATQFKANDDEESP